MGLLMKNKTFGIAAAILGAAVLLTCSGGCALTPWGVIQKNTENSRKLRVGMTKAEVLEIMGEPIRNEKFCEPDMWFYYREMVWGDGLLTEDECLPLIFEDGKLIGWGNNFRLDHRLKRRKENPGRPEEPEPETVTKPAAKPEPKAKPAAKPEPKAKPAAKPELKAKPAAKPEPKAKPAAKPEPKAKPAAKPEPKAKPAAKPEPKAKPAAKPEPKAKPATKPEPKEKPAAEPKTVTKP
jgi:outer membrane protein assembly factor BamE (lipoprotein component of BamABCDE complex)